MATPTQPVRPSVMRKVFLGLGIAVLFIGLLLILYFAQPDPLARDVHLVPQHESNTVVLTLLLPEGAGGQVLAHYTERLAWLPNIGRNSRPEDRDSNAWTNDYAVGYWLSGPPEDLPDMLRQLKVVFDPIDLPQEFAETERDIILREYDWRIANNPDAQAAEEMDAFLYDGNTIAASVIGTPEQIKALTYDDAKAFQAETHRPERARLVVVGDISEAKLRRTMEAVGFPDLDANRKVIALPEPVDFDLLEAQTALARDILDTNLPGGLAGPLRFDAFVTKSFGISIVPINEQHIELIFSAEPDKGIGFAVLQSAFEAALATSDEGVPTATDERVRERFKGFWPGWSDDDKTAQWMANYTLSRVSVLREPKTERQMRKLDAQIDAADINSILAALAGPGRTAIAFIGTDPSP